jgi:YfiR/HmsC-like
MIKLGRSTSRSAMASLGRYRRLASLMLAALAGTITLGSIAAQPVVYDANQVKAAFLYNFGTYVQWPTAAPADDAITIAVLGEPAVAAQLAAFLPGRRIEGRPVEVRTITRIEDSGDAEIVFIGRQQNARLAQLTAAVASRPVLIVTDAEDGLEQGAMVNFKLVGSRVRFEISLRRAEESGLALSSRLLSAALRVVTSECCRNDVEDGKRQPIGRRRA